MKERTMSTWDKLAATAHAMNLAFACGLALGYVDATPFWTLWLQCMFWPMLVLSAGYVCLWVWEGVSAITTDKAA